MHSAVSLRAGGTPLQKICRDSGLVQQDEGDKSE